MDREFGIKTTQKIITENNLISREELLRKVMFQTYVARRTANEFIDACLGSDFCEQKINSAKEKWIEVKEV